MGDRNGPEHATEKLDMLAESLVAKGVIFEQLPTEQRYLWKEAVLKAPCVRIVVASVFHSIRQGAEVRHE